MSHVYLTRAMQSDHRRRKAAEEEAAFVWAALWAGFVVFLVVVGIVLAAAGV